MEEKLRNNLLLDFYGNMLTEKQRHIMSLYIEEDSSLSEIAGIINTSRQAVYDAVKSSENILNTYEEKLKCVERYLSNRVIIIDIVKTLEDMPLAGENNKKMQKVIENLKNVLKNQ